MGKEERKSKWVGTMDKETWYELPERFNTEALLAWKTDKSMITRRPDGLLVFKTLNNNQQ